MDAILLVTISRAWNVHHLFCPIQVKFNEIDCFLVVEGTRLKNVSLNTFDDVHIVMNAVRYSNVLMNNAHNI